VFEKTKTRTEPKTDSGKDSARLRRCLLCGETFASAGPYNRICKRCKSSQVWRQG
jgi:hypothetical protein